MSTRADHERAKLVIVRVQQAFIQREGLLEDVGDLVECQIPDGVELRSRDHALFLFYTVANDHGMKSSRLYDAAKRLFSYRRDLFEPHSVLTDYAGPSDPRLVADTGIFLGTRYPRETAKTWYVNSQKLHDVFCGDPRNLFQHSDDAGKLLREIMSFRGYGPKTGGMLLRAIAGLEFANIRGFQQVLLPVDIHDSRISFLTGIMRSETYDHEHRIDYHAHVRDVQKVLLAACNSLNIPWLDVDRALWLIGSRGCVNKRCMSCPLQDLCSVGRTVGKRQYQPDLLSRSEGR